MGNEMMDLTQLASYLQRDVREVSKMASRGYLPGQKVGGNWRFARAEINHWLETQMHAYTEQQLTALETSGGRRTQQDPPISSLLSQAGIAVAPFATTPGAVLPGLAP